MRLTHKRILGLPVRTQSGHLLGKVSELMIETDTGRLEALLVRPSGLLHGLIDRDLIVAWVQIILFSETEVVVQDGVVPLDERRVAGAIVPPVVPPSVSET